jgi:hypothetical protein
MKDCAITIPSSLPDIVITTETPGALSGTVALASAIPFVTQGTPCTYVFRHARDAANSCEAAEVDATDDLVFKGIYCLEKNLKIEIYV